MSALSDISPPDKTSSPREQYDAEHNINPLPTSSKKWYDVGEDEWEYDNDGFWENDFPEITGHPSQIPPAQQHQEVNAYTVPSVPPESQKITKVNYDTPRGSTRIRRTETVVQLQKDSKDNKTQEQVVNTEKIVDTPPHLEKQYQDHDYSREPPSIQSERVKVESAGLGAIQHSQAVATHPETRKKPAAKLRYQGNIWSKDQWKVAKG